MDAGNFLYIKRYGKFDAMIVCWNHLDEHQRRDVASLIGWFYDESKANLLKEPWALPNIKKFLNFEYVKLDDLAKLCAAYLATWGDDSVFVEPPFIDISADDTPKVEDNDVLLNKHNGFTLNPKKLIKEFQHNPSNPKAQGNLFRHYTNYTSTAYCVASAIEKKNGHLIDIDPTAGLNVEVSDLQQSLINPTSRDTIVSDIIDQVKRRKGKEEVIEEKAVLHDWEHQQLFNNSQQQEEHGTH